MDFPNRSFAPFFDTLVKISAPRPSGDLSFSVKACVMPIQSVEPFDETGADSGLLSFTVLLAASGDQAWIEAAIGSRPQIGDRIELATGMKAAVKKVSPLVDAWYELEVRQC